MSSTTSAPTDKRRRAKLQLAMVFVVFAAPMVAAILVFNFWRPTSTSNYGELLTPQPFTASRLTTLDGKPFQLETLRDKWLLLHVDSGACEARCRTKMYNMRQSRTAQGKHIDQIERVFLILDEAPIPAEVLREYAGTHFLRLGETGSLNAALRAGDAQGSVFVVDPVGQLMMRYPPGAEPKGMLRDLRRLLKVSSPD